MCETPIHTKIRYVETPKKNGACGKGATCFAFDCCKPKDPTINNDFLHSLNDTSVLDEDGQPILYDAKRSTPHVFYRDYEAERERARQVQGVDEDEEEEREQELAPIPSMQTDANEYF